MWTIYMGVPSRKFPLNVKGNVICLRSHMILMMESGTGKSTLLNGFKSLFKKEAVASVDTSWNPEQFVGKTVIGTKVDENGSVEPTYTQLPGYLKLPLIVMDEALPLMLGEREGSKDIWTYLNTATNPYGANLVQKGRVDAPISKRLGYFAEASLIVGIQPAMLPAWFLDRGFFARPIHIFIKLTEDEVDDIDSNRFLNNAYTDEKKNALRRYNTTLTAVENFGDAGNEIKRTVLDSAVRKAVDYGKQLRSLTKNHSSTTVRKYGESMRMRYTNVVLKYAYLYAQDGMFWELKDLGAKETQEKALQADGFEVKTTPEHVDRGFELMLYFLQNSVLEFMENYVVQSQHRTKMTTQAVRADLEALKQPASIMEFIQSICNNRSCGSEAGRKWFQKYKDKKLVASEQVGQRTTKVALTKLGKKVLEEEKPGMSWLE
jgi:hypothetical protein